MRIEKKVVSIIIPTFNEALVIKKLLQSIKKQTYKFIEIVLVDDGSTDNTVEIAKRFADKVFKRDHSERSVQRNFGARNAEGEYLMFIDADMVLTGKVVEKCVKKISEDGKIGGVVIKEESVARSFWEKVKAFERSFYNLEGDKDIESARFFPKKIFDEVGGFDETITGPEDWDFPEMIREKGYRIDRVDEIIFHYERVSNPFKLAKKKYYYALKANRYFIKHNIPLFGSKAVYFLRPVFYKNWKRLVLNPLMSFSMFFMMTVEMIGGGLGYLVGKYRKY